MASACLRHLNVFSELASLPQIATIGLAASTDVLGVALGSLFGQALCTGVAVLGGRQVASLVDERVMSALGGLLFVAFGAHALYEGVPA